MSNFSTGKYAKAISDRSGQAFPYREMVREWNGSWVHKSEFEQKHPQLVPRKFRGDAQGLQHARPARTEPAVAHMLGLNAMQAGTTDTIVVNVNDPGHGYSTGDRVKFSGCESHFPAYPQVSHMQDHDINAAEGHILTKIDDENYSFSPNDIISEWLTANCNPGTTTVYVDMDGVLTEYYQRVAEWVNVSSGRPFDGDWYNMTPADEVSAIATAPSSWFQNLAKRAEANALIDLVMSKNNTWDVLSTGPTYNAQKTAWITTHFGTPGSGSGRAPASVNYATDYNKAPYGGANKLLIDDRTTYINQFEGAGGKGFKYFESGGIKDFGGGNMSVGPLTILA